MYVRYATQLSCIFGRYRPFVYLLLPFHFSLNTRCAWDKRGGHRILLSPRSVAGTPGKAPHPEPPNGHSPVSTDASRSPDRKHSRSRPGLLGLCRLINCRPAPGTHTSPRSHWAERWGSRFQSPARLAAFRGGPLPVSKRLWFKPPMPRGLVDDMGTFQHHGDYN
ncbi:hypothetical protein N656DRAFT_606316 [Canariomyces notabilis]|uniref:Uncharacterized protein n=1 Tax=Canariomyces notabilis TaxID=2074819 RepID=A0AAN6YUF6_9PEZI|nr:hypothetical protein N656DRAFT_606316 [Canariomyces arenarius]